MSVIDMNIPGNRKMVRAITLKSALGLYVKSQGKIMPTRGVTLTGLLKLASDIVGKGPYARSMNGAKSALQDVATWIEWAQTPVNVHTGMGETFVSTQGAVQAAIDAAADQVIADKLAS